MLKLSIIYRKILPEPQLRGSRVAFRSVFRKRNVPRSSRFWSIIVLGLCLPQGRDLSSVLVSDGSLEIASLGIWFPGEKPFSLLNCPRGRTLGEAPEGFAGSIHWDSTIIFYKPFWKLSSFLEASLEPSRITDFRDSPVARPPFVALDIVEFGYATVYNVSRGARLRSKVTVIVKCKRFPALWSMFESHRAIRKKKATFSCL